MRTTLNYDKPADSWNEALPLGNGRLGCMCFGRVDREELQINEESIWAGPPVPENRSGGYEFLQKARSLLFNERYAEAQNLVQDNVMAERISPRSYQPLGSLFISLEGMEQFSGYSRALDIESAVAWTEWKQGTRRIRREVFISEPSQTLCCRTLSLDGLRMRALITFTRERGAQISLEGADSIRITGQAEHGGRHRGVRFQGLISVSSEGGTVRCEKEGIRIEDAREFTIHLSCSTDYNFHDPQTPLTADLMKICRETIRKAEAKSYDQLKEEHTGAHRKLYHRMSLTLGKPKTFQDKPTDQRLKEFGKEGSAELVELYFNYARYLMISCSRPGTLCANLQGIWNQDIEAIWNSDYHININIQMIYWLAEAGGLPECHTPFLELIESLVEPGRKTAAEVYKCRGTVAHHTTDVWHFTAPLGHVQYGMWPMAAGWCCRHFMEHYEYGKDRDFLRDRALPLIEEVSRFFLDYLVEDPETGMLLSGPGSSPENMFLVPGTDSSSRDHSGMSEIAHERFYSPEMGVCNLSMGCAMDQQIIFETLTNYLRCLEILGIRGSLETEVRQALPRLGRTGIAPDGRLMEWWKDLEELDPGHRHISHVYGLYPGREFCFDKPLREAAEKTIRGRLESGGGHTGWSRAWIINLWARLNNADEAWHNFKALINTSTLPNLFDNHPPFQLDGNMGGAGGLLEMLVQSHGSVIELFPAWPEELPEGEVRGLRVRGGYLLDFGWKDSKLLDLEIRSKRDCIPELVMRNQTLKLDRSEKKRNAYYSYRMIR